MAACSVIELAEETRSFLRSNHGGNTNAPTAESHFKAYAEAGLHDLTHRLIGEVGSHGSQQQGPQNLQTTVCACQMVPTTLAWIFKKKVGFLKDLLEFLPWVENLRSHFQLNAVLKTDRLGNKNDLPSQI